MRTRSAFYEMKPTYMREINKIIFGLNLDMSRGVFGLPGRNNYEILHKTDYSNVLSDL